MVGEVGPPPAIPDCIPEEDNCSEGDSEGADHSYLPPEVFSLTWHADVGDIMHMDPHIAYITHLTCHQLSLDLLCVNATCLVSISYHYFRMLLITHKYRGSQQFSMVEYSTPIY